MQLDRPGELRGDSSRPHVRQVAARDARVRLHHRAAETRVRALHRVRPQFQAARDRRVPHRVLPAVDSRRQRRHRGGVALRVRWRRPHQSGARVGGRGSGELARRADVRDGVHRAAAPVAVRLRDGDLPRGPAGHSGRSLRSRAPRWRRRMAGIPAHHGAAPDARDLLQFHHAGDPGIPGIQRPLRDHRRRPAESRPTCCR